MLLLPAALALALAPTNPGNPPPAPLVPMLDAGLSSLAMPLVQDPAMEPVDAAKLSYTYVELGVTQLDVDTADEDVDIYYGRASLGLGSVLYIFGEYQNQSIDIADTDANQFQLGAGAHFPVTAKLDLLAEIGWIFNDISSDDDDIDDSTDGYEVFGGARWMVLPWEGGGIEINGGVGFIDLENRLASEDEATFFELGARAHFLRILSVGATYTVLEDDDQISGGVRLSF